MSHVSFRSHNSLNIYEMFTKNTYMYEMSKLWSVFILIIVVLLEKKLCEITTQSLKASFCCWTQEERLAVFMFL